MRKRERKQLIETLVRQRSLTTQSELVAALAKLGCEVTQATVSRDLRELGARKGADGQGRTRFEIPPPRELRNPREILGRVLRESDARWQSAQNMVVIRSEPGTAPTVGRALDEFEHPDIIGTVAGDDTVLLVMADSAEARKMAGRLSRIARERG